MVVTKSGKIIFFNECFQKMVIEKLKAVALPENIFKLTEGDEQSTNKMKNLFNEIYQKP